MTLVEFSYVNYPHGGRVGANYTGDGGPFDMSGLVRLMSTGTWPAILGSETSTSVAHSHMIFHSSYTGIRH